MYKYKPKREKKKEGLFGEINMRRNDERDRSKKLDYLYIAIYISYIMCLCMSMDICTIKIFRCTEAMEKYSKTSQKKKITKG